MDDVFSQRYEHVMAEQRFPKGDPAPQRGAQTYYMQMKEFGLRGGYASLA